MINKNSTKDEVMTAVKRDGLALAYASKALQGDRDVVLEAVRQNPYAIAYSADEFCNDRDVMREVLKANYDAFRDIYFGKELTSDNVASISEYVKNEKKRSK